MSVADPDTGEMITGPPETLFTELLTIKLG